MWSIRHQSWKFHSLKFISKKSVHCSIYHSIRLFLFLLKYFWLRKRWGWDFFYPSCVNKNLSLSLGGKKVRQTLIIVVGIFVSSTFAVALQKSVNIIEIILKTEQNKNFLLVLDNAFFNKTDSVFLFSSPTKCTCSCDRYVFARMRAGSNLKRQRLTWWLH